MAWPSSDSELTAMSIGSTTFSSAVSEGTAPAQDALGRQKKQATFGMHESIDEDRPVFQSDKCLTSASLATSQGKSYTFLGGSSATLESGTVCQVGTMQTSSINSRNTQLTRRKSTPSEAMSPKAPSRVSSAKQTGRYSMSPLSSPLSSPGNQRATARLSTEMLDLSDAVTSRLTVAANIKTGSEQPMWRRARRRVKLVARRLLDSYGVQGLMAFLTVFVLVGDDIRVLAFEKSADWVFNVAAILCLFLFTLECTVSSWVKEDYFLGFWFFMDVIATASLIFDITYVSQAIDPPPELSLDNPDSINGQDSALGQSEYARASRSSRVGTRVARLLRVVRLIQISRFTNFLNLRKKSSSPGETLAPGEEDNDMDNNIDPESRIGRKLSERVTQRVIILVLIMLFVIPQLNPGLHHLMMSSSAQYGADVVFANWVDYEEQYLKNSSDANLLEPLRQIWETDLLMYIYYHNWHSAQPEESQRKQTNAADWLMSLCFVGYLVNKAATPDALDNTQQGYIQLLSSTAASWDAMFSPAGWEFNKYVVGVLPDTVKQALVAPWTTDCSEESGFYGVSLLPETPCPRKVFRKEETMWYLPSGAQLGFSQTHMQGQFVFLFDLRRRIAMQAAFSISVTAFAVIVLAIGALGFSKDADRLVLAPIERMIRNVIIIRRDPLYAIKLVGIYQREPGEVDQFASGGSAITQRVGRGPGCCCPVFMQKLTLRLGIRSAPNENQAKKAASKKVAARETPMETLILENVIVKLGSLLVLGFGDAGSEIIKLNMDDDNGSVNPLIPGSRVEGIYGFCSIRHFATTINVLQEKTMVYVNQIAEIVHRVVDEHLGGANKNVGEAFLLVWRLSSYAAEYRSKIADSAVLSFVQVIIELSTDVRLSQYREHPALLARLPDFRVAMGFGLHLGWSIEGAIGSEFKIDASYLSPHVNLATMLEAVTEDYGVSVLMSEPLVSACSILLRRHFRAIDHVKFFGSKFTIRLFTLDLNQEALPVDVDDVARKSKPYQTKDGRSKLKHRRLEDDSLSANIVFDNDVNVTRMRERFFLSFLQQFERGYLNYEAGEWSVATQVLTKTMVMLRRCSSDGLDIAEDGPSKVLIEFMERHGCEKPEGWPGYRELSEKGTRSRDTEFTEEFNERFSFDEFSEGNLRGSMT